MSRSALVAAATLATARGHEIDFVDDNLELRALLPFALPRAVTQLAFDGDLAALRNEVRNRLGTRAEHRAIDEVRVVLPFAGLAVLAAVVDSNAERHDGHAGLRAPNLRVARQVTCQENSIDAHGFTSSCLAPVFRARFRLVAVGTAHDHVTLDAVVDAQDAIKLCNVVGIGMEIDEDVVTLGQMVDLISEFALAPVFVVIDRALAFGDDLLDFSKLFYRESCFSGKKYKS